MVCMSITGIAQLKPISRPVPGQDNQDVPLPPRPSAADMAMAQKFQESKSKLPMPVATLSRRKKAMCQAKPVAGDPNPGIDLIAAANAPVCVVAEGLVASVFTTGGNDKSIIVQHGNYFTVYSGLASVNVKDGQHLAAGDKIGLVAMKNGKSILNFQIWKAGMKGQREKLNPEEWLKGL